jgi:hypothetical protein
MVDTDLCTSKPIEALPNRELLCLSKEKERVKRSMELKLRNKVGPDA